MRPLKLLMCPLSFLLRIAFWLLLVCLRRRCGNVWVIDFADECSAPSEFYNQIERALSFIHERDPRRARWIEAHLDYIIDTNLISSGGMYSHGTRACHINYAAYRASVVGSDEITQRVQEVLTIELAQLIVHEATHARIDHQGVKYDEHRRERIEKRCRREESQFVKKSAGEFTDLFGKPVDWEAHHDFDRVRSWYKSYWRMSRFDHLRHALRKAGDEIWETSPTRDLLADWNDEHRYNWESSQAFQPWTEAMVIARAIYSFHAHDNRAATANFRAIIDRQPENDDVRNCLAIALYRDVRYQDALDVWKQAFENGNWDVVWWIRHVLSVLGRDEEALNWLDREPDEDHDEFEFLATRAMFLIKLRRYEEAINHLDRAWDGRDIKIGTDEFAYRAVHALLLREMGQHNRFREVWDELRSIRDWWRLCSDAEPVTVDAWVLRTRDEMWHAGILPSRSVLLISLDKLEPSEWYPFFEHMSETILASRGSDDGTCDVSYLRSLSCWNDDYPWREVPENLTGDKRVYAMDMTLDRIFLPGGCLQDRRVSCWITETADGCDAVLAGAFVAPIRHDSVPALPEDAPAMCCPVSPSSAGPV